MQLVRVGDIFVSRKNGERYTVETVRVTAQNDVLGYFVVDRYGYGINVCNHPYDMSRWETEKGN